MPVKDILFFGALLLILLFAMFIAADMRVNQASLGVSPDRMTVIIQKCYKVDLSPVIVRNDKGHVIDVFCKEKSNGSVQP